MYEIVIRHIHKSRILELLLLIPIKCNSFVPRFVFNNNRNFNVITLMEYGTCTVEVDMRYR